MKRTLISAFALLLAAAAFSACGDAKETGAKTTEAVSQTAAETEPVTEAYTGPDLPEADFGGETFAF